MPEIRLHPTGEQYEARLEDTARAVKHAEGRIRAYESTLSLLLAERAITLTATGPLDRRGDAPRWLILADNGVNRPQTFAYWGDSLDWLEAPTFSWLEGIAELGDDDGWFPLVQIEGEAADVLRRAWGLQRRWPEVTAPFAPFPLQTEDEIRVIDRLYDPLPSIQIAWGGHLDAALQFQVSAMMAADEPRMAADDEAEARR